MKRFLLLISLLLTLRTEAQHNGPYPVNFVANAGALVTPATVQNINQIIVKTNGDGTTPQNVAGIYLFSYTNGSGYAVYTNTIAPPSNTNALFYAYTASGFAAVGWNLIPSNQLSVGGSSFEYTPPQTNSLIGKWTDVDSIFTGTLSVNYGTGNIVLPSGTYWGFVGTGTRVNQQTAGANTYWFQRSFHTATSPISYIQVGFANFYCTPTETGSGAPEHVTASVEYPSNTITLLTFNGSLATNIPSGTYGLSDRVALQTPIPEGAMFWVRAYHTNSAGVAYNNIIGNTNYNLSTFSTTFSSVTDSTGGGNPGALPGSQYICNPLVILGWTAKPSILMIGDSRLFGLYPLGNSAGSLFNINPNPSFGAISRLVDREHYGSCNVGAAGEYYSDFYSACANRMSLTNWATCVLTELGINDLDSQTIGFNGLLTNTISFATNCAKTLPVYAATLEPKTTSSDFWTTLVNQTFAGDNAGRVAYNQALRNNLVIGIKGYLDMASPVESASNSGLWQVTGQSNLIAGANLAAYTEDGLHATDIGQTLQSISIPDFFLSGAATVAPAGAPVIQPADVLSGNFTGSFTGNAGGLTNVIGIIGIVYTNLAKCTTGTNAIHYTVPAGMTNSYTVNGFIAVTALSVDVAQPKVIWTDENGTAQTISLGSSISGTGYNNLPNTFIRAKGGTVIDLTNSLTTGTGSITYDVSAHLIPLDSNQ